MHAGGPQGRRRTRDARVVKASKQDDVVLPRRHPEVTMISARLGVEGPTDSPVSGPGAWSDLGVYSVPRVGGDVEAPEIAVMVERILVQGREFSS